MQQPKAKTSLPSQSEIAKAVLRLAADKGWYGVTPELIAQRFKKGGDAVLHTYPDTRDFLPVIGQWIAEETLQLSQQSHGTSIHDGLFDMMMARFEVMQTERKGILAIASAARQNTVLLQHLLPEDAKAMQAIIRYAQNNQQAKMPEIILIGGLLALHAYVFWVWSRDDTPDLSRTMATLDRALRRIAGAKSWVDKICSSDSSDFRNHKT